MSILQFSSHDQDLLDRSAARMGYVSLVRIDVREDGMCVIRSIDAFKRGYFGTLRSQGVLPAAFDERTLVINE